MVKIAIKPEAQNAYSIKRQVINFQDFVANPLGFYQWHFIKFLGNLGISSFFKTLSGFIESSFDAKNYAEGNGTVAGGNIDLSLFDLHLQKSNDCLVGE